jgi:AraC family transcriptional regulator of adaptative response / DNA-3-methyladenine glycosylase II
MKAHNSRMGNVSAPRRADGVEMNLPFKMPYDWRSIIRFYQSHWIPGVERVTDDCFARVFRLDRVVGFVEVRVIVGKPQLKICIMPVDPNTASEAVRRVRKMFDLDCDPAVIANSLGKIPLFATLCGRFPGLRLARGWDPFETAVCAILGQLVGASQRTNLIGQLVSHYGEEIIDPSSGEKARLFPTVEILARSDLSAVKTTRARREAIRDFSRRVLSGAISFSDTQDPAAFRKALLETRGLGPWSAEYISLRALGDADAFPKTDLILKRALELHTHLELTQLQPWRSYAATYLWKAFAQTLSKSRNGSSAECEARSAGEPQPKKEETFTTKVTKITKKSL